jgi:hypothetical protein
MRVNIGPVLVVQRKERGTICVGSTKSLPAVRETAPGCRAGDPGPQLGGFTLIMQNKPGVTGDAHAGLLADRESDRHGVLTITENSRSLGRLSKRPGPRSQHHDEPVRQLLAAIGRQPG